MNDPTDMCGCHWEKDESGRWGIVYDEPPMAMERRELAETAKGRKALRKIAACTIATKKRRKR